MDIRDRSKKEGSQVEKKTREELNDSLIYNIMKKIELREQLMEEYKKEKQLTNKHWLGKYFVHSQIPVYYASLIVLSKVVKIIYMKPGAVISSVFTVPNILFHVCVFLSLNEYYKYKNIFHFKHQLGEEYRIYQKNVETLMDEKIQQFSLVNKIVNNSMLDQDKLMQVFKYRMVL